MHPAKVAQLRAAAGFLLVAAILGCFMFLFGNRQGHALYFELRATLMAVSALLGWQLYSEVASRTGLAVCISFGIAVLLEIFEHYARVPADGLGSLQRLSGETLNITVTFPTAVLLVLTLAGLSRFQLGKGLYALIALSFAVGLGGTLLVTQVDNYAAESWLAHRQAPLYIFSILMTIPFIWFLRLYVKRGSSFHLGISIYLLLSLINIGRWGIGGRMENASQLLDLLAQAAIPFGFALDGLDAIRRVQLSTDSESDPADRDPLTGVYNRRALGAIGSSQFDESLKQAQPVSVLMFDIDHFKRINDTHGHAAGDAVLRQFAGILAKCVRGTDLIARYGGEEFTAVLPGAPLAPAMRLAERIRSNVEAADFSFERKTLKMTVSIGAATAFPDELRKFEEVIENADRNLYRAKKEGRNRVLADAIETIIVRKYEQED
jgi:diguanylate cyclase (GGDEF)-like protein